MRVGAAWRCWTARPAGLVGLRPSTLKGWAWRVRSGLPLGEAPRRLVTLPYLAGLARRWNAADRAGVALRRPIPGARGRAPAGSELQTLSTKAEEIARRTHELNLDGASRIASGLALVPHRAAVELVEQEQGGAVVPPSALAFLISARRQDGEWPKQPGKDPRAELAGRTASPRGRECKLGSRRSISKGARKTSGGEILDGRGRSPVERQKVPRRGQEGSGGDGAIGRHPRGRRQPRPRLRPQEVARVGKRTRWPVPGPIRTRSRSPNAPSWLLLGPESKALLESALPCFQLGPPLP